jgi:hypothetical protein
MKRYFFLTKVPGYITFPDGLRYYASGETVLITDESIATSLINKQFPGSESLQLITTEEVIKLQEPVNTQSNVDSEDEVIKVEEKPKRRGTKSLELE